MATLLYEQYTVPRDLPHEVWDVAAAQHCDPARDYGDEASSGDAVTRRMHDLIVDSSRVAQAATALCEIIDMYAAAGKSFEPSKDAKLMADLLDIIERKFPEMTPDEFEEVFGALQGASHVENQALAA